LFISNNAQRHRGIALRWCNCLLRPHCLLRFRAKQRSSTNHRRPPSCRTAAKEGGVCAPLLPTGSQQQLVLLAESTFLAASSRACRWTAGAPPAAEASGCRLSAAGCALTVLEASRSEGLRRAAEAHALAGAGVRKREPLRVQAEARGHAKRPLVRVEVVAADRVADGREVQP
jgi:hypothetical protein